MIDLGYIIAGMALVVASVVSVLGTTSRGQMETQALGRAVEFGVFAGFVLLAHAVVEVFRIGELWYAVTGLVFVVLVAGLVHQVDRASRSGGEFA